MTRKTGGLEFGNFFASVKGRLWDYSNTRERKYACRTNHTWVTIWNYVAENNYCSRKETSKSLKSQDYSYILSQADPKYDAARLTFLPPPHTHCCWERRPLGRCSYSFHTPTKAKPAHRTVAHLVSQLSRFSLRHRYHCLKLLPSTAYISVDLEQRIREVVIKKTHKRRGWAGRKGRQAWETVMSSYSSPKHRKYGGQQCHHPLVTESRLLQKLQWTALSASNAAITYVFSHIPHPGAIMLEKQKCSRTSLPAAVS